MYKRIVVKLGTSVLTGGSRLLDGPRLVEFVRQLAELHGEGRDIVVCTSGAIAVGRAHLDFPDLPPTIVNKQVLASVGQTRLMLQWGRFFDIYGIHVGQILLTRADAEYRQRYLNARDVFSSLLEQRIVPVVNENDALATDEIKVGDNDNLSALVATLVSADLLLMLTDQPGLFTGDPRTDPDAELIHEVNRIDDALRALAGGTSTGLGVGGMSTKLTAANTARHAGIDVVIAAEERADDLHVIMLERLPDGSERIETVIKVEGGFETYPGHVLTGVMVTAVKPDDGTIDFDGANQDTLDGDGDADIIIGSIGDDSIVGGSKSDDLIVGGDGGDDLSGNAGDDTIFGLDGDDLINGGAHDDLLYGGEGADTVNGNADDDTISGGPGSDTLDGDGGDDTLLELANIHASFTAIAPAGTLEFGHLVDGFAYQIDTLLREAVGDNSFEYVYLEGGDDDNSFDTSAFSTSIGAKGVTLIGLSGDDTLISGDTDDSIFGGGGDDIIETDGGNDFIDAGAGGDTVYAGDGADTILGFKGNDYLHAGDNPADDLADPDLMTEVDIVFGDLGNDTIIGDETSGDAGIDIAVEVQAHAGLEFDQQLVRDS